MVMDALNYFSRMRCPKIVNSPKNADYQANNQVWWSNQFKELEAGVKVPPYRKLSELKKIFSPEELRNLTLAGLEYENDESYETKRLRKGPYFKVKRKTARPSICVARRRSSLIKKQQFAVDLMKFLKKTPNEANCWSSPPKKFYSFIQNIKRHEEILAQNYEDYFNNVETIDSLVIDKKTILSVYEIKNTLPISKSILFNFKMWHSVPDSVAEYLRNEKLGTSYALRRELYRDVICGFEKPVSHAFGTMLPVKLRRFKNTSNHQAIAWFKKDLKHENLRTFAAVFEGILNLETSKRFILWLRKHNEIEPPEYLLPKKTKKQSKNFVFIMGK